jgi:hypothetical protein
MKRNNPNILNALIESLSKGNGRVQSCHMAGISYDTFCDIINPGHKGFNFEFVERLKKAEGTGKIKIKEICESVIMKAATDNNKPAWQAAAWMLERKFKDEYALKVINDVDLTDRRKSIDELFPSDDEIINGTNSKS